MNRRRSSALVVLALVLLAPGPLSARTTQNPETRPTQVATIPVVTPVGTSPKTPEASLALNPKTRRAYQLVEVGNTTLITSLNLDTLQPIRSLSVPYSLSSMGSDGVDSVRGRIFVKANRPLFGGVGVIDEARFETGDPSPVTFFRSPLNPVYGSAAAAGIRYEQRTNKLLILLNPQRTGDSFLGLTRGKGLYTNFLAQWDATTGAEEYLHPIRQCSTASINSEAGAMMTPFLSRDGAAIYAMCSVSENEVQMLRLPLGADQRPTTEGQLYPAGSNVAALAIDPVTERVHMISSSSFVLTFDWKTRRLAGTSGISSVPNVFALAYPAVDETTGRLVITSPPRPPLQENTPPDPGGLYLIDGRRSELPQALVYEELAAAKARVAPVIDPAGPGRPRRIFVRHSDSGDLNAGEPFFRVIADPVPVSKDAASGDLDPTTDVDESDQTESSFAGEANAYGMRLLVVGGVQGPVDSKEMAGKCAMTNREVVAASVQRAGLSSVSASARAHGADADLGTQADFKDVSRCMIGGIGNIRYPAPPAPLAGKGPGWTFSPAECSGVDSVTAGDAAKGWQARAVCKESDGEVKSDAVHNGATLAGITVSHSSASTTVRRDAKLGIVSETVATAEGIDIPGVGKIALIKTSSRSRANGRVPKQGDAARAEREVEVCGIQTPSFQDDGCRSGADIASYITALNDAGRNRVFVRQPAIDPSLAAGSPGGYQAGIQRERGEAALAKLENGDELLVVPALEIIVRTNADAAVRRYVLQLAGVRTVSTYGIAVLPAATMPFDDAESIVEELGLDVNLAGGFAPVTKIAGSAASLPERLLDVVADQVQRVYRTAFKLDLRNPGDAALALGVWMTFGTPLYLADRRRRYREMLL